MFLQNSELDASGVPVRKKSILVNNTNCTNNVNNAAIINDAESVVSHHSHGKRVLHLCTNIINNNINVHSFRSEAKWRQSNETLCDTTATERAKPERAAGTVLDLCTLHAMSCRVQHTLVGATALAKSLSVPIVPIVPTVCQRSIHICDW